MTTDDSLIVMARQPILNQKLDVFGYEFFYRSSSKAQSSTIKHTVDSDTSTIINLFSNFNLDRLLDGKKAFLNCVLEHEDAANSFDMLNKGNVVLEIQELSNPKDQKLIDDTARKMKILKEKGFILAGSETIFEERYQSWLEIVQIVKFKSIKYSSKDLDSLEKLTKYMALAKKMNKITVIEMIEDQQQFESFKKFNFDYYQGYFFSKPINLSSRITTPSMEAMIRLTNLINSNADTNKIEQVIKSDPTIAFKLLRYLNTVGVSGSEKIDTIKRAIDILGSAKLLKWVTVLFSSVKAKNGIDAISKTALIRARLMELLSYEIKDGNDSDSYFITGIFSMLDAMLDVDIEISLGSIDVSTEIKEAILKNKGKYAPLLNLSKFIEDGEWIEIFASLYKLNIDNKKLSDKYLEAVEWADLITK